MKPRLCAEDETGMMVSPRDVGKFETLRFSADE
jgi:hypothetical protein